MFETDDMDHELRKPVGSAEDEATPVAPEDTVSMTPATSGETEDDGVTEADEQSFPASDAPPWTSSVT
jgi:hypothetical protein